MRDSEDPSTTPPRNAFAEEFLNRFEQEDVRKEVGARAAVLLRHARPHEPELGELREELAWETVLAVPLGRVRLDLGADEVARERLDLPLLGRELEVHYSPIVRSRVGLRPR